jgi:hypothetical protein
MMPCAVGTGLALSHLSGALCGGHSPQLCWQDYGVVISQRMYIYHVQKIWQEEMMQQSEEQSGNNMAPQLAGPLVHTSKQLRDPTFERPVKQAKPGECVRHALSKPAREAACTTGKPRLKQRRSLQGENLLWQVAKMQGVGSGKGITTGMHSKGATTCGNCRELVSCRIHTGSQAQHALHALHGRQQALLAAGSRRLVICIAWGVDCGKGRLAAVAQGRRRCEGRVVAWSGTSERLGGRPWA